MLRVTWLLTTFACVGTAIGQVKYWTAVRVDDGPNELRLFDGSELVETIEQYPGAAEDPIGFRDGASDPDGYVYFGWSSGVVRYNDDGTAPVLIIDGPPPSFPVWRALAFDATGDSGNGSLWAASYDSPIIEVDLSGNVIRTLPNPGMAILALADDRTTPNLRLWALTEGGYRVAVQKADGAILGQPDPPLEPNVMAWAGLSKIRGGHGGWLAIGDGRLLVAGQPPLGPWQLPAGAYTGVANVYEACAGILCGDANCDGKVDAEDIDAFFAIPGDFCPPFCPPCDYLCTADINRSGGVDAEDIDPFFEAVGLGYCP